MTQMTENTDLQEQLIDDIADALTQRGFIHLQHLLPVWLALQLMHEAKRLAAFELKPAGIGRNNRQHVNSQVRTDSTLWLCGNSDTQLAYLDWMEQLRMGLNRRLFMGLFDFECHFSHYSRGDFYQCHLDAFKGRSNRILSSVFYLNPHWSEKDGGELLLYADEQPSPLLIVPPQFNSCILFLSEVFPHEVLTSHSDRFSIAGWYRVNGQSSDYLDPSQ